MTQLNQKGLRSAAAHLCNPCKAPKRHRVPFLLVLQARLACVLFFLVSLSCSRLIAQTATGSIAGTVLEKSGNVVANASVTLTNTDTNQVRTASTNERGYYSLPLLPPASYRLSIETPGFSRFVQSDIHLNVGDALTVNPTLQVGQVSQEVTVTGQPSSLETETSSLGQVLSNKTILYLPVNGRNSYSFAALVPGVLASAGFTQTAFDIRQGSMREQDVQEMLAALQSVQGGRSFIWFEL